MKTVTLSSREVFSLKKKNISLNKSFGLKVIRAYILDNIGYYKYEIIDEKKWVLFLLSNNIYEHDK